MFHNQNPYHISDTDLFLASNFPKIQQEIVRLKDTVRVYPNAGRTEIIVSFIKYHKVSVDLAKRNPDLVGLLNTSGELIHNMEFLFESCENNEAFCAAYESHLDLELNQ